MWRTNLSEEKIRKIPKDPFLTEEEREEERREREETAFLDTEVPPFEEEEERVPYAEVTRPIRREREETERIVGIPIKKIGEMTDWRIVSPASETVCAERDVERVRVVRGIERVVGVEVERPPCVVLPETKRCFEKGKPFDTNKDKVKALFACADETAGYLTPSQVSALSEIGEAPKDIEKTEEIMKDLTAEKNIKFDPRHPNWVDDTKYYIMVPDMRKKVRDEMKLTL